MTTDTDLAYIAGLIDGEGYIGVKKSQPYHRLTGRVNPGYHARLQIRMVDEAAIKFIAETMGGWYYTEKPHATKGRPLFCYQSSEAAVERILRLVLPYLRVKRPNADAVLELRALQLNAISHHRTKVVGERNFPNKYGTVRMIPVKVFSDEYMAALEAIYERCKALNHAPVD